LSKGHDGVFDNPASYLGDSTLESLLETDCSDKVFGCCENEFLIEHRISQEVYDVINGKEYLA
jgi:hypothetical protein